MSEAPRGQLVYDGVISRRRGDAKEVAFAPEVKRKEKLRPLRVARMLALAHECEALIASRVVADRTELAGVLGFTKARVTQLLDLTLLAPDIQEEILAAEVEPGWDAVTEHALRAVVRGETWDIQRERWRGVALSATPAGQIGHNRTKQGQRL
jgi:hypothetical protein